MSIIIKKLLPYIIMAVLVACIYFLYTMYIQEKKMRENYESNTEQLITDQRDKIINIVVKNKKQTADMIEKLYPLYDSIAKANNIETKTIQDITYVSNYYIDSSKHNTTNLYQSDKDTSILSFHLLKKLYRFGRCCGYENEKNRLELFIL